MQMQFKFKDNFSYIHMKTNLYLVLLDYFYGS